MQRRSTEAQIQGLGTSAARKGASPGRASGDAYPPSANRGGATSCPTTNKDLTSIAQLTAFREDIDFLTVTTGTSLSEYLIRHTEKVDDGFAKEGFSRSEQRAGVGFKVWRKWEPTQPSKRFGSDYESWEADGNNAACFALQVRHGVENVPDGRQSLRASRVDVAWDYPVWESLKADDVLELMRGHAEARRIKCGIVGSGGVNTRFVGSRKTSDRYIRIYRKDLEDASWAWMFGPVMRIELVLRAAYAAAFFDTWLRLPTGEAMAAAAAHVQRMTGQQVRPEVGEIPTLEVPEALGIIEQLQFFFIQHGPRLAAMNDAGIDVMRIARVVNENSRRETQWRNNQRRKDIEKAGAEQVERGLVELLSKSEPMGACL